MCYFRIATNTEKTEEEISRQPMKNFAPDSLLPLKHDNLFPIFSGPFLFPVSYQILRIPSQSKGLT